MNKNDQTRQNTVRRKTENESAMPQTINKEDRPPPYTHRAYGTVFRDNMKKVHGSIEHDVKKVVSVLKADASVLKANASVLKANAHQLFAGLNTKTTLKSDQPVELSNLSISSSDYKDLNIENFFEIPKNEYTYVDEVNSNSLHTKRTRLGNNKYALELSNLTDHEYKINGVFMCEIMAMVLGPGTQELPVIYIPSMPDDKISWSPIKPYTGAYALYTPNRTREEVGTIVLPAKIHDRQYKYVFVISTTDCQQESFTIPGHQLIPKASWLLS